MIGRPKLLLASNSPRRNQLLALGNWDFEISIPDVDESQLSGESPADYVLRLAKAKALAAAMNLPQNFHPEQSEGPQAQKIRDSSVATLPQSDMEFGFEVVDNTAQQEIIVIGADTAVVDGNDILGKPRDASDAAQMLERLRGHTHQVYTGLALYRIGDQKLLTELCITDVPMRTYSDEEIRDYVLSGDPLDKAGAYAIQHAGFQPVESLHGCYASVMGLPLCHLLRALRQFDVHSNADVPANCQSFLKYECPVSQAILRGDPVG